MRRLAVFCGGFAAGIFAAQYLLAVDWLLPVGLACIGAGVLTLLLPAPQRKRAVLCLVGAALALGWDWLYIRQVSAPMEALAATRQTLTMTLTDYPTETRFGAKVTVRAEGLPGKLVYYGDSPLLQLCPGQRMTEDVYLQSASRIRDDDVTVQLQGCVPDGLQPGNTPLQCGESKLSPVVAGPVGTRYAGTDSHPV